MSAPLSVAPTQLLLVGQPGPKRISDGDFCLLRAEAAVEDNETIRFGRSKRQEAVADAAMEGEIQRRFEAVDLVAFAFSSQSLFRREVEEYRQIGNQIRSEERRVGKECRS